MTVVLLSIGVFALAMVGLAIGLLVSGRSLRGSCGGSRPLGPDGTPLTCDHCTCRSESEQSTPSAASTR